MQHIYTKISYERIEYQEYQMIFAKWIWSLAPEVTFENLALFRIIHFNHIYHF